MKSAKLEIQRTGVPNSSEARGRKRCLSERVCSKMRTFGAALLAAFVLGVVAGQSTVDIGACSPTGPRVACGEPDVNKH